MDGIFISYRREDSSGHAGRLRDNLRGRFGSRVFRDVDAIADGEVFEHVLEKALSTCQVAVIVIGRTWLTCTDAHGRRRLDDPEDWVRVVARMLLGRGIRVIPVLVGGAAMPRVVDLPEDLHPLVKRQSRELRDISWEADVSALSERLNEIIGANGNEHRASGLFLPIKTRTLAAGTAAVALVAAIAWTLFMMSSDTAGVRTAPPPAIPETTTLTIDVALEQGFTIDESLLSIVFRHVQNDHIAVARLLDSTLGGWPAEDHLDVDEVIPQVLGSGKLRSPDKASYTILVTSRRLSRLTRQLDNLFYFAHHRFGVVSVRNFDDDRLALFIRDIKQDERPELLRKYLTALIPLTALLGQADARNVKIPRDRGPAIDRSCLSDFSNDLKLLVHRLRIGPEMCPEESGEIAKAFGPTVAAEYKAILNRAATMKPLGFVH